MKTNFKLLGVLLALMISAVIFPKTVTAQQGDISFQVFYDELSPYGEWVDYPRYGYVWIPDAGPDFMPYSTQGQWIYTDYGWTWVSNYEWGWAPFHYGRWDYDNYYGWLWVPDNQWGPSWVTWVRSDGYYGWQPMQPGISISLSFGRDYRSDYNHWTFVRDRDFERSDMQRYYVNRSDNDRIMQNYTVINQTYNDRSRNTTYISGPAREDVQRVTGKKVRPVAIRENERPGQVLNNNQLQIYRPNIRNNQGSGEERAAPKRITNIKEVKQPSERNATNQQRNVSPSNDVRKERQPNNVRQQNNDQINQPQQQRNVNPSENRRMEKRQQKEVTQPENRISQPAKQQNVNPSENKKQRENMIRKQNDKNNVQQPQKQKVDQPVNKKQERQQKMVTPQNQNNKAQPAQQRNASKPGNKKQEQQQNKVAPQNQTKQLQPTQSKVKQTRNSVRQERRTNTVKQQNTTKQQKAKKTRQEKVKEDKK